MKDGFHVRLGVRVGTGCDGQRRTKYRNAQRVRNAGDKVFFVMAKLFLKPGAAIPGAKPVKRVMQSPEGDNALLPGVAHRSVASPKPMNYFMHRLDFSSKHGSRSIFCVLRAAYPVPPVT